MKTFKTIIHFVVMLITASLITSCVVKFKTIRPGNVGVKSTFGKIHDETLNPGLKLYFFGTKMYQIDTRIVEYSTAQTAIAMDGVALTPRINVFYSINPDKVSQLLSDYHRNRISYRVNPNDFRHIVRIKVNDALAKVISSAASFEEVNTHRHALALAIKQEAANLIENDYFIIHKVLVNNIEMSMEVKHQITQRAVMSQELTNVELEIALRSRQIELAKIKAEAEKSGYEILQPTLSPEVLRKAEIDALREMGKNSNTLIIRD